MLASISAYLPQIQIVSAILMAAAILLQNQGTGAGFSFGGSTGGYRTKRGLEKKLFTTTIILSIIFFASSLAITVL